MTDVVPPANLTRAPFELASNPSPASMTPALTSSSLNFIISEITCTGGMIPASDLSFAFSITMNRIVLSPVQILVTQTVGLRPQAISLRCFFFLLVSRIRFRSIDSAALFFRLPESNGRSSRIFQDTQPAHVWYFDRIFHNFGAQLGGAFRGRTDVIYSHVGEPKRRHTRHRVLEDAAAKISAHVQHGVSSAG